MTTLPPWWQASSSIRPRGACRRRLGLRGLDAVIDGVADHVQQWIADGIDDVAIEFGVAADLGKLNILARLASEVADDAGHFLEDPPDGDHAHGHRQVLQGAGDFPQLRHIAVESLLAGQRGVADILGDHRLGDDQLPDGVDEGIEAVGRHLDGRVGAGGQWRRHGFGERRQHLGRARRTRWSRLRPCRRDGLIGIRGIGLAIGRVVQAMQDFGQSRLRRRRGVIARGRLKAAQHRFGQVQSLKDDIQVRALKWKLALAKQIEEVFSPVRTAPICRRLRNPATPLIV